MSEVAEGRTKATVPETAGTKTCPRCRNAVRYGVCAYCRLRLNCRACSALLTDPERQTACDVCGEPVEQMGPDVEEAEPVAEKAASLEASPPTATTLPVESLVEPYRAPDAARWHAGGYAAALIADERWQQADEMVARALGEEGDQPARSDLLLLRAHCAQQLGLVGAAISNALDAAAEDITLITTVAPQVHTLLVHDEAAAARQYLLDQWAGRVERVPGVEERATIAGLELRAAILEYDTDRAVAALERAMAAGGEGRCRELLAETRLQPAPDGRLLATLARVEERAGMRPEAIADAGRAADMGLADEGPDTIVDLLEFRAQLFDPDNEREQAAEAYRAAGERAYFDSRFEDATRLLRLSLDLEEHATAQWFLADTLRVLAAGMEPVQRHRHLEGALDAWDAGAKAGSPDAATAWSLDVLAAIRVALAEAEAATGRHHWVDALLALERRVLLDDGDLKTWQDLSEHYERFNLHAAAYEAAERARGLDEDDKRTLLCLAFPQTCAGAEGWQGLLEQRLADEEDPLLNGILLVALGRFADAIPVLRQHLDAEEDALEARLWLGHALFAEGLADEAQHEFEELWAILESGGPGAVDFSVTDRAEVAFWIDRHDQVEALLAPLAESPESGVYETRDIFGTLALSRLARGETESARSTIRSAVPLLRDVYAIDDLLRQLQLLSGRLDAHTAEDGVKAAEEIAEILAARREELRQQGLSLATAIASVGELGKLDHPAAPRAAALAQSRLLYGQGGADAAEAYLAALNESSTAGLPERAALLARLLHVVDPLVRGGRGSDSRGLLEHALSAIGPDMAEGAAYINARLFVVLLESGDVEAAGVAAAAASDLSANDLAEILRGIVGDGVDRLRALDRYAHTLALPTLTDSLHQLVEELFQLNVEKGDWDFPIVLPIMVEIPPDLVPEDKSQDGPLFGEQIPALRDRVKEKTGVTVAGVRVRQDDDLPPGTFRISIAGGWPVKDRVELGMIFVPSAAADVKAKLGTVETRPATDPLTGEPACWVAPGSPEASEESPLLVRALRISVKQAGARRKWKKLFEKTGAWDDPLGYVLRVLERLLREHPAEFIDVDSVAALVEEWRTQELVDGIEDFDAAALARLSTLLRDLLYDGVRLLPQRPLGADLAVAVAEPSYPAALRACRQVFEPTGTE
jgi:FHIPEP family